MQLNEFLVVLRQFLATELFDIGTTTVTVATALTVLFMLVATVWLSRISQSAVQTLLERTRVDRRTIGTTKSLIRYVVLVVGFTVALQTAGIDLTTLFAAGAIFAIAVGFAMQNIAQNFVAGVILLAERTIKPGDVLEVEGRVVRVEAMGIRSTIARSRDGEELIVPNSILVQSTVKNYTLADAYYRMQVSVGVVYRSDMSLVRRTLEQTAAKIAEKWGVSHPAPLVVMAGFGDNAVEFKVAIWMSNPWQWLPAVNDLHEAIWWAFHESEITIAFPQLDVHFDSQVTEKLGKANYLSPRSPE
jgi:small-conductance mechanosensitive channel